MLERKFDATRINEILNDPSVFPYAKMDGQDKIDLTVLLQNDKNILLMDDLGGFLFDYLGNNIYEAHPQYLPKGRGKHAFKSAKEAVSYVFDNTDCEKIIACAPQQYKHSILLARRTGFEKICSRKASYKKGGCFPSVDEYVLTRTKWSKLWQQEQQAHKQQQE